MKHGRSQVFVDKAWLYLPGVGAGVNTIHASQSDNKDLLID